MIKQLHYLEFFDSLIKGNKEECRRICLALYNNGESVTDIYLELFQKSLYKIGKMWEDSKINIAEEHAATTIIDYLITMLAEMARSGKTEDKSAIVSCIDKEFHQIGAKMVANLFEIHGWQTYYLGANTPSRGLLKFIEEKNPDYVGLSINFHLNTLRLLETLDQIRKNFPEQKIVVGGQGVQLVLDELKKNYPAVIVCESLQQLEELINSN